MRLSHIMITSLALGLASVPALAVVDAPPARGGGAGGAGGPPAGGRGEGGGRGRAAMPQASPEQLKSAYEAQANYVSGKAGVSAENTGKVVAAYLDARASQTKAIEDMRATLQERAREAGGEGGGAAGEGGGGRGGQRGRIAEEMQKAMTDINAKEKDKLKTALNGFLKPEQTEKLIGPLGSFDRQWDQVTVAIVDLKLDSAKQAQAMGLSETYSEAIAKSRDIEDMQDRREANTEARRTMNEEMKKMLTEEQYAQFQRAIGGGGGRGQGGAGGAGGGGRGGNGGQGGGGGGGGGGAAGG